VASLKKLEIIRLANMNRLSLADSFLIATANEINVILLTTDKNVEDVTGKLTIFIEIK